MIELVGGLRRFFYPEGGGLNGNTERPINGTELVVNGRGSIESFFETHEMPLNQSVFLQSCLKSERKFNGGKPERYTIAVDSIKDTLDRSPTDIVGDLSRGVRLATLVEGLTFVHRQSSLLGDKSILVNGFVHTSKDEKGNLSKRTYFPSLRIEDGKIKIQMNTPEFKAPDCGALIVRRQTEMRSHEAQPLAA
jgi:hypothetical protein